jgi:6-pyruvoyltetrahydropterin/6-carboxytetrahydropterin synthase
MFTIAKRFSFAAAHQLDHLPPEHPCARLHGHNYEAEFIVEAARLDPATGFIYDYRNMDLLKDFIDRKLDHQHLNEVMEGDARATTAESLALFLHTSAELLLALPEGTVLVAVRVSETPKTWAEYRP